ncbi:MAG: tRNA pseudouridine(55) synthase TruB [Bacteroidia bacterium]|nr:tRNA pseudouridine(55) synthase TruB [Bacteroidia bacterium]
MSRLIDLETGTVLLVNKPITWTSFDVTNKIKRLIQRNLNKAAEGVIIEKKKVKVGHAGTLDPLATGLLIICVGRETKNIDKYMGMPKIYTGSFYLGATTPSFDKETAHNFEFSTIHINSEMIYRAALNFMGEQNQIPPIYSAIKKDGKRAYVSARAGEAIALEPRKITIYSFEITEITLPIVYFKVVCSKGTYIRSLARDFGTALQSGAYLNSLCRTQIGDFSLKNALSLEEIAAELGETMEKNDRDLK